MPAQNLLRRLVRIVSTLVLALLLTTCVESAPAGPILSLVDANAVAAAVVDSPYKLFQAMDAFWNAAGIRAAVGSDFRGFLAKNIPNIDAAESSLDFARPWAVYLLPLSPGSKETRTVVCIAYRGQPNAFLNQLGSQGSMKLVKQASGYAVFATEQGDVSFPPAKTLDLRRLAGYPTASLKLWADPNKLREQSKDDWKPMEAAARQFVSGEAGGSGDAASALGTMALALLAQLRAADAAIVPDARGISLRVGASLLSGSPAEALIGQAAKSPSALDLASQVSADALYGYAWSLDPGAVGQISTAITSPLLAALGIDSAASARIAALQTRWTSVAGPRGAASFDIKLDPAALKSLDPKGEPSAISQAMAKAMSFKLELVQELRDETRYAELMKGLGSDQDLRYFLDSYRDKLGLDIQLKATDRKDGAFAYGELGLGFKVTDAQKLASLGGSASAAESPAAEAGTQAALEALGQSFSLRWAVAKGRFSATTGDLPALKALVARSAAPTPLSAVPDFADFAKTVPATALSVGYLSAKRMAQFVRELVSAGAPQAGGFNLDPERLGLWYGYLSASPAQATSPAALETGLFIPAADVLYLIEFATSLKKPDSTAMR